MKFTLSWLKDHLKTDVLSDDLISALTDLGLEVENVIDLAKELGHFLVGEIIEASPHPNADRLKVCKVSTGHSLQQIICGAPNARAGIKVVVAQPGDFIPGLETKIKIGKIRGIESHGMMCSERELMLSDEHEGIIEVDDKALVGGKYIDQCDDFDVVIDIATTPNRPDALGVRGIARDLAAKGLGKLRSRQLTSEEGTFSNPISVTIAQDVVDKDCPQFAGRFFRGVKNVESPKWLRDRLTSIGLRPISALVDITNFVTFDMARPLHVFDASKLNGELTVRKAREGESILALDGLEYKLGVEDTVISSGDKVESIAGIIGGLNSGCSLETTDIFLESAYFDPISTAKSGRKLKINSDARYRFERGIDPLSIQEGIDLATNLIKRICGGEVSKVVTMGKPPITERKISLRPHRVESLVGINIARVDQLRILKGLGFEVTYKNNIIYAVVPSWRPDIFGEVDLIEEIVRVTSLSKLEGIPLEKNNLGVMKPVLTMLQSRIARIRRSIAILGMNECISYSFIDAKGAEVFTEKGKKITLVNPISSEMTHLRPSLIPGLLQAAFKNQARSYQDLKFFEVGEVFWGNKPGEQETIASGIFVGKYFPKNAYSEVRSVDVFDAKKIVESVLSELSFSIDRLSLSRESVSNFYHPGRAAKFCLGSKNVLAQFGELHPKVIKQYGIKGPVIAYEIFIENIPFSKKRKITRPAIRVSEFQPVDRDFSFVVKTSCEVSLIEKAILSCERELIAEVRVFDIFEGKDAEAQLGKGMKSVAFTVRLQPFKTTLTDTDLEVVSQKIIANVSNVTGATLRSCVQK